MAYTKPLPLIDAQSRPYWEAAHRHELRLPKCHDCGSLRIHFERWCPHCGSEKFTWALLSGRATVWSHCTFHRKYFPEFEAELPYGVALVQLEEGPKLITNIVGVKHNEVRIGMPLEVFFDDVTPDVTLVKFRPA